MLLSLHIKNYALIEDLHLEFVPELNIFTGETGAGKSIIIESLGLILGERASSQVVRKGASRCFITGEFECAGLTDLKSFLEEAGINCEDETLIIRREIDAAGKSRAFVNDCPVNIATLESIGTYLVDVHGQHEHQALLHNTQQRQLLDRFGGHEKFLQELSEPYTRWKQLLAQKESQGMSEQERERLIELYGFQLKELDSAKLAPGEEEEMERTLPGLKNAEKLLGLGEEAYQILYGTEGAALEKLNKVKRILETINTLGGNIGETAENLQASLYQIEETAREIEAFRDSVKLDPETLNALLERQDLIHKLKRKYGNTIPDIIAYRNKIAAELDALSKSDKNRQELEKEIEKTHAALCRCCEKLSSARKKAADKLSAGVEKELTDLGMKKSRFIADVKKGSDPANHGWDIIEFMFSANQGEDIKPLKNIASGGEMSRVMLALKTVLAKADQVPVLVFDEIDAGIGGPMGQTIGRKLHNLARHHQTLCITHLPQIAAFGTRHMSVAKATHQGRTATQVAVLAEKDRLEEIARMLSGEKVTPAARTHAEELILQAGR